MLRFNRRRAEEGCGVPRRIAGTRRTMRFGECMAVALVMATAAGMYACGGAAEPPLRIAIIQWIGYQPVHLARSQDDWPDGEMRVAEFASNTESLRAFRNGNVEVAALTLDEALLLRADGHDIRIILVMDYSHGADTIVAQREIESLADLEGRRVGVENSAATAYLLARGLAHAGLDTSAVEVVRVNAGRHEQAFREGEVDALATFEPIRSRLLEDGARELFDSTLIPGEIVDVLVVDSEAMEVHRGHLQQILETWFEGLGVLEAEPGRARDVMAERGGLTAAELDRALGGVEFPSVAENCQLLAHDGEALQGTTWRLADLMEAYGLLPREITPEGLFDDRFVQALGCPQHDPGDRP